MMGYPSVVWQQQMEKAITITYNNTHLYQKSIPVWVLITQQPSLHDSGPSP